MPWHPQQAVAVKGVARSKNVGWTDGERTVFYPDPKHWGRIKTAGGIDRRQRDRDAEGVEGVGNLKTNLVHSRAVRKPLVAIILSVLKCMFYTT